MTHEDAYKIAQEENRPVCFNGDLICNKCGEPWNIRGTRSGDMSPEENIIFQAERGYPRCSPITQQR